MKGQDGNFGRSYSEASNDISDKGEAGNVSLIQGKAGFASPDTSKVCSVQLDEDFYMGEIGIVKLDMHEVLALSQGEVDSASLED